MINSPDGVDSSLNKLLLLLLLLSYHNNIINATKLQHITESAYEL